MKEKRIIIISVVCGIICALCVALFMLSVYKQADSARNEALSRYGGEQVEVFVAARDIVAGERLDFSSVESKLWIADLLPENAVQSSGDAMGKTITSPIYKGEVITQKRFEAEHGTLDIPSGKQAISVPAKAVQAVGGAIHAGMSIDVYSSGDTTTSMLASDVNVLDTSVGTSATSLSSEGGWITLAVIPEKVQDIIAVSQRSTLYFVLPGENSSISSDDKSSSASGSSSVSGSSGASGSGSSGSGDSQSRLTDRTTNANKNTKEGKAAGQEGVNG